MKQVGEIRKDLNGFTNFTLEDNLDREHEHKHLLKVRIAGRFKVRTTEKMSRLWGSIR